MQITTQHAEGQSVGTWEHMEKGFLLRGIARERGDIVCRYAKLPTFIESNFTDAALPLIDQAPMSAGITFQSIVFEMLGQVGRTLDSH